MNTFKVESFSYYFNPLKARSKKITLYVKLEKHYTIKIVFYQDMEKDATFVTRLPKSVELSKPLNRKKSQTGLL